jgi:NAD(P)-dependent dehydrogenase (short-subunit alcohol dehydrogenase family)
MADTKRVAVITGAAQGIGKRTAEVLAERGYALALSDLRSPVETLRAVGALRSAAWGAGAEAIEFLGDISDDAVVSRLAAAVRDRWGRVDVLVNNAGISMIAPAETLSAADYRRVLEVNLVAPFLLAREFGKMMLAQGSGAIINVASVAGLVAVADRAAYNASKHGLIGLTRTLAAEWGGRGVRVNAVCPGWVKTEMDAADQAGGSYTDADITGRVPMARFASPDDIAKAIAFLAEPQESGFVNGHALAVDGGWTSDGSWESLRLRHR